MTWKFGTETITFCTTRYRTGGAAIEAWCFDGCYATIGVNMPDAPQLAEGQFYLKDWSENALIAQAMREEGLIEAVTPPVFAQSGFVCTAAYRFTELGRQYCDMQPN